MGFEITEASVALTVGGENSFNRTMSRVRMSLQGVHNATQRASAALRSLGTRFIGIGTIMAAPMAAAVKGFADAGDSIAKMSKRTGFSVESLSELSFAAQQSGTSITDLETSVRLMQRTVSDAVQGSATAANALSLLGLEAKTLAKLTPEEQFKTIADRLSKIVDPSLKAAIAMDLFGRSGTALLPMIEKGAAGINELQEEARRLGLTMSSEDAAAAEELTDAFGRLSRIIKMLTFNMGAALAPTIKQLSARMAEIGQQASAWIKQNGQIVITFAKITAATLGLGAALIATSFVLKGTSVAMKVAEVATIALSKAIAILNATMMFFAKHPLVLVLTVLATLAAYLAYTRLEGETFGQKMASLAEMIADAFGWLRDTLANLFAPVLPIWNTAITWIKQAVFDLGFIFRNFDAFLEIGVLNATLLIVGFANDVKYWFTEALPQYIVWFGDNWKNILKDIASWTKTVLQNIGRNFANFFKAVYDAMKMKGWNFDWTPLTEGFERATEKMPEIAQRNLSPLEKALKEEMDKATKKLGEKYHAERYAVPDVTAPAEKAARKAKDVSEKAAAVSKPNMASIETPKQERSGIGFTGVSEMWNRLASSLGSKDVAKKQLDETVKLNAEQRKHGAILEQIAKHTGRQTTATLA